ncbi:hypothetical protein GSI_04014 [Ganoderma sinense ZZ0214-1]|uniref:Protein kinase domain-containing protein n=1 Tax=Ganoderma sinense ZZ0214-1 TaxID=1077348 RepID=A0A2G8SHZ4_9APHY|nr:hypothetical protein GSI_04014 [Ganoderma sinense ZZ0214-1]
MEELLFTEDARAYPTIPDAIPCAVDRMDSLSVDEMLGLWFTAKEWLLLRGVRLYGLEPPPGWGKTRIARGQDMVGRDIILKVIQKDSPQHHIFQTLLQHQSLFTDPRTFPGVLPPIDIIETPHKYSIVTMPLWGTYPCLTEMEDVRQVLTFIRCLLEGLSFLHANRIAHRDICDSNMVVSCYRPDRDQKRFGGDLRELRRGTDIRYAFMDYDQSIQLPLDVSVKHCRRPSREAWMGCDMYKPLDVSLGESQYNPFAFDVAMLGNMFRAYLSEAIPTLPALAALFDGMTTHVVSRRFSADEALDFFKSNIQLLPQEVLVAPVTLEFDYEMMYHPERLDPQHNIMLGLQDTFNGTVDRELEGTAG